MMGPAQPRSLLAMLLPRQAPGARLVTEKSASGKTSFFPSLMNNLLGDDGPPNRQAPEKARKESEPMQASLAGLLYLAELAGSPVTEARQWQVPSANSGTEEQPVLGSDAGLSPDPGQKPAQLQTATQAGTADLQFDDPVAGPQQDSTPDAAGTQTWVPPGPLEIQPENSGDAAQSRTLQRIDFSAKSPQATVLTEPNPLARAGAIPSRNGSMQAAAEPIAEAGARDRHSGHLAEPAAAPAPDQPSVTRRKAEPSAVPAASTTVATNAPSHGSEAPAEAPSAVLQKAQTAQSDSPPAPQSNWTAPAEVPDLAFAARLISMAAQPEATVPKEARPNPPESAPSRAAAPESQPDQAPTVRAAAQTAGAARDFMRNPSSADSNEATDSRLERPRKTVVADPTVSDPPLASKAAAIQAPPANQAARISGQPAGTPDQKPQRLDEAGQAGSAPPKAPLAAHDIRIEIQGEDQRVQVRLVERGGEVHVAVHTPDAHLAETLREDLPGLSSRLTESGFQTETWRPGVSAGTQWHRQTEASSHTSPDSNGQARQNGGESQQQQQQPGRPKVPREELDRKEKGKDFEWFMSTTR